MSLIYKDASLGNPVQIAVVRMLLLKDQEFVLTPANEDSASSRESHEMLDNRPGKSASEMLRNFCKWQRVFNDPDDANIGHHDTALLLTRYHLAVRLTIYIESNQTTNSLASLFAGKTFAGIRRCLNATP